MADARILTIPVPIKSNTTHFQVQYSDDRSNWTSLLPGQASADIAIAALSSRKYTLDGVNTTVSSTENRPIASAPPKWYRLRLKHASGYEGWLEPFVVPSQEDFIQYVKRHLKDPVLVGGSALLDDLDYLGHVANAIREFESFHPRLVSQTYDLTSNTQTYNLPDDWANEFSRFVEVEYPVNSEDPRAFIPVQWLFVDEPLGQWRFRRVWPSATEDARVYYHTRHARDGSTVPTAYFEAVAIWAAGDAAEQIMAYKNQFGDVMIGADYVAIDPRVKQWERIARSLKAQARSMWAGGMTGIRANLPAYEDHGVIPYSVTSSSR